jgi:hypothetical protein
MNKVRQWIKNILIKLSSKNLKGRICDAKKFEFETDVLELLKKYDLICKDSKSYAIQEIEIKCKVEELPSIKIKSFIIDKRK